MEKRAVKILHCSDVHIGMSFKSLGLKAERRKSEIKDTFFNLVSVCIKESPDLILISGDLFDDVSISESTVKEIKSAVGKIGSKIIISPGNHDPFVPGCPYDSDWPENVIIFKNNTMDSILLEDLGVRVWGSAFTGQYQYNTMFEGFSVPKDDFINICVMHGDVCTENTGLYNPITIRDIALSGMDYIALGHIHKRSDVVKSGGTYYSYPGCIEGLGLDEAGEKGYYIGTVSKGYCNLLFQRICRRIVADINIDVSDCKDTESCTEKIMSQIEQDFGEEYAENLYRITLKGDVLESVVLVPEDIESRLNSRVFYIRIHDDTQIDLSECYCGNGEDLKGIFIRRMKNRIDSATSEYERDIAKTALKVGLRAFSREVKYSDYY